jgi:hypothetical protein
MCDPITALSVASAGFSYIGGQQQARNAITASNNSANLQYQQINEKQGQINDQSAIDQSERNKQGLLERAQMATIAGESGALGLSSDRILGDSFMQEGTDMASMEKNRQNALKQSVWEGKQAEGQANVNNSKAYSTTASLIGTGLQIGTDVYTGTQKAKAAATASKPKGGETSKN